MFFQYEIILLAYIKFGNFDDNIIHLLQQYFLNIKKETFEKECARLYKKLCIIEKANSKEIRENPSILGCILSEEFIAYNYKYILGTFLAIYAYKYSDFSKIVYLNNHINDMEDKTISDICLSIGIDINDERFPEKLFTAMSEYINNKQKDYKSSI